MLVSFSDLQLAFEFVSSGGMGENGAYLDRQSGKIYWHSEFGGNGEELPDDIDDEKYIATSSFARPGNRGFESGSLQWRVTQTRHRTDFVSRGVDPVGR